MAWITALLLIYLVVALIVFGVIFRKELRAWRIRQKLKGAGIPTGTVEPPLLSTRLYELDKVFSAFGSDAAHPSALYAHKQFIEAVGLLALPSVPLAVVLQYVEGNSWSLASAAIAALRKRSDRGQANDRVLAQCPHLSPWAMYFALDFIAEAEPAIASARRRPTPRSGGSTIAGCRIFSATISCAVRRRAMPATFGSALFGYYVA